MRNQRKEKNKKDRPTSCFACRCFPFHREKVKRGCEQNSAALLPLHWLGCKCDWVLSQYKSAVSGGIKLLGFSSVYITCEANCVCRQDLCRFVFHVLWLTSFRALRALFPPSEGVCDAVQRCLPPAPAVMAKGTLAGPGRAPFPSVFSSQRLWKLRRKAPLSLALLDQQMPWAQGRAHVKRAVALLVATRAICLRSPARAVCRLSVLPATGISAFSQSQPVLEGRASSPRPEGFSRPQALRSLFSTLALMLYCAEKRVRCSGVRKEQERWFCHSGLFSSEGQWSRTGLSPVSGREFF